MAEPKMTAAGGGRREDDDEEPPNPNKKPYKYYKDLMSLESSDESDTEWDAFMAEETLKKKKAIKEQEQTLLKLDKDIAVLNRGLAANRVAARGAREVHERMRSVNVCYIILNSAIQYVSIHPWKIRISFSKQKLIGCEARTPLPKWSA